MTQQRRFVFLDPGRLIQRYGRILVLVAVAFSLGVLAGGYVAARLLSARAQAEAREQRRNPREIYPVNPVRVRASIDRARDDGPALRQAIVDEIVLKTVQVQRTGEGFLASYYGFRVRGLLDRGGGRCLVVYVQGHNGSPGDFDYYHGIARAARARDCDVLGFSLVGMGLNAGPLHFPSAKLGQTVHLSASEAANHELYRYFSDELHPQATPLSLFLSGHYAILREAVKGYEDVSMIGISGGGWATTLLSAMIPEIDRSISWAGSFPNEYRLFRLDIGDLEQDGPFYDRFDYWTLYTLGEIDTEGQSTRSVTLVYNDQDDCCFADPAASAFQRDMRQFGRTKVMVVKSIGHVIQPKLAEQLLFPVPGEAQATGAGV